jgi:hypothetical protein
MAELTREEALAHVDETELIGMLLGGPPKERVAAAFGEARSVPLRRLHAAAIVAALRAARKGQVNVLALEGNPGIGKTTAVMQHLQATDEGYVFLYVSPRVVINKDVTGKFARAEDHSARGILTLTTNANLIASAPAWYREVVAKDGEKHRYIDSAAVVDGVDGLEYPVTSTLYITPDEEHVIEEQHSGSRFRKKALNEREDLVEERNLPGVLRTLASSARELLRANPKVKRAVLTAALQGYREVDGGSTIKALSNLFDSDYQSGAGKRERAVFSGQFATIVVMVDEVAGDGAGAPFVHAVAQWLDEQFINPFIDDEGGSPFKVILIVADASLANDVVLRRYLEAGSRAPDKVLVSPSPGNRPFQLAANTFRIGGRNRNVLHVMANSFPAKRLRVDYLVRTHKIRVGERADGTTETLREAVRREHGEALQAAAFREIQRALEQGAKQVIYFAQDKPFLRDLEDALTAPATGIVGRDELAILDSSVSPAKRKVLVDPRTRDGKRVFLMTSSGARGVSFGKTDWIIASVPRFQVEASLMEIAQLIYRGRGTFADAGREADGDRLDRRLVMLVNDYLVDDEGLDQRQWLRRGSDLLTLLMLLRATILTRILGDAGLRHQRLAVVPVGSIGTEELLSLMSQAVGAFLREAEVFLREKHPIEASNLVGAAQRGVQSLFSGFKLEGVGQGQEARSLSTLRHMAELASAVAQGVTPLYPNLNDPPLNLPSEAACVGPLWVEDWGGYQKTEAYRFEGYNTSIDRLATQLFAQLAVIDKKPEFPIALKRWARDLLRLLARGEEEAAHEFATIKPLATPYVYVGLPLDYPRFWRKADEDGLPVRIDEPEEWLRTLGRAMNASTVLLPVIPSFEAFPYVVSVGRADPGKLEQVFDDRYFMASTELNLLNTLLLEGTSVPAGNA